MQHARWQNRAMKKFLAAYWFLLVTVVCLAWGFTLPAGWAWLPWAASSAVGLGLSTKWLIDAIKDKAFGSDVLAVVSIIATALISEWLAAAVISLMLASGRALETWAEGRAHSKLEALLKRAPQNAHVLDSKGNQHTRPIDEVPVGSTILVKSGEVVPLDGKLLSAGTFDESALTGEPLPVFHEIGVEVASGVVNSDGSVELVTTQDSKTSTYAGLIRLVQQAQAESASAVRIANKWAVRFVPFAIGLSLLTWLFTQNVNNAVAVIVAATPCPLILAVPVAIIAGMSKAASKGAIIKGGAALEQLARTKVILLDKTGTLTHGGPSISSAWFAPGTDEPRVLQLAASLEQSSPHVVAKAVIAFGAMKGISLLKPTQVSEAHGVGLTGLVDGLKVFVGQPNEALPAWCAATESLLVAVSIDGQLKAVLGLDDPVRSESAATIASLRGLGVDRLILVSGDRRATVEAVSAEVGADSFFAECTPAHKMEILRAEQATLEAGKADGIVVVVGDGINDAPALAAAGVGVAMGARGATAASEAADVVIIEDSITNLAMAVDVAQGARGRALQASGFGMALAVAAMLFGAFGLLNATGAALSQEVIDAAAILWALVPARSRL
mgnify:CR=1 FL=1